MKIEQIIKAIFSVITGLAISFLGEFSPTFICLLIFMCVDYLTGVIKAIYNKQLNSEIGFKGIIKKVLMLVIIGIANTIQVNLQIQGVREIVLIFYICNEGLSILENIGQCGIEYPQVLKNILEQLRNKDGDQNGEI